jgi:hypothetical protein
MISDHNEVDWSGYNYFFPAMLAPWHGADGHLCFKKMAPRWWVKSPSGFLRFSGDPLTPDLSLRTSPRLPPQNYTLSFCEIHPLLRLL